MSRNVRGFLKPEPLASGLSDQYAVIKDGVRHEVSLSVDPKRGGYVVRHFTRDLSSAIDEADEWETGTNLGWARVIFRREVRALGGRA